MKFQHMQMVQHVKTGGVYRIVAPPTILRIEATNAPAYAYRKEDESSGIVWVRPQSEMEDGRFVPHNAALTGAGSKRTDEPNIFPASG